jgi:hypothetical protein
VLLRASLFRPNHFAQQRKGTWMTFRPYVTPTAINRETRAILGARRPGESIFAYTLREKAAMEEARLRLVKQAGDTNANAAKAA